MSKITYLAKRIKNMSYKGLFDAVKKVHEINGKSKIYIFFDIVFCGLKYQAGYTDYTLFEMYRMNKKERATIITRGINNSFIKRFNDPEARYIFHDKILFNRKFEDYIHRDWMELKTDNFGSFVEFTKKHPEFVAKPVGLQCGKGIEVIDTQGKDLKEIYRSLLENRQFLLEERVVQCKELSAIHPDSINTLRVVTLNKKVVVAFLRMGDKHYHVDNFNHEGLAAPIDINDGIIKYKAINKKSELYDKHPLTGTPIVGIQIPHWKEVVEMCEEAAKVEPLIGYVGWDVCVMEDGLCFIEANEFPGHDIYQLPPHREGNWGLLPTFLKAAGDIK